MPRVAIIGGGWYGCHTAATLLDAGHDVVLFERNARLLHEASGNNQYRLHHGYHYPRNYYTRRQSVEGFARFLEVYPHLTRRVDQNIYAVPRQDSLLDFRTYCTIMRASALHAKEIVAPEFLVNTEGRIETDERVVLTTKAREYFTRRLETAARLQTTVPPPKENGEVEGERFDWVVDATWGAFKNLPVDIVYQPTLLLYYEALQPFPAITFVDGPLCSIYPTEDPAIFTLSSVLHTPICSQSISGGHMESKREAMETQIARYIPGFLDIFRYVGPQFSRKTKPVGASDDRAARVFQNGRAISILSGKIDGIFYAADKVMGIIGG